MICLKCEFPVGSGAWAFPNAFEFLFRVTESFWGPLFWYLLISIHFFPPSYEDSAKSLFQSTAGAGLGWQPGPGACLSPVCGGVLQADPWLSFTCHHRQMTVLVRVKYRECFLITFLVFWAPYWPPDLPMHLQMVLLCITSSWSLSFSLMLLLICVAGIRL